MSSFFDFLFQNKDGEYESLLDIVSAGIEQAQIAMLAEAKAVNMIANAVSKSEVVLSDGKDRVRNDLYYKLNVRPNPNQTASAFWRMVVEKLLNTGDCVVVPLTTQLLEGTSFYIAESYSMDTYVMLGKSYTGVTITDGINSMSIQRSFREDDVLHFRYDNRKVRLLAKEVSDTLSTTLSALNKMVQVSNTPIFKYKFDANTSFVSKNADGTVRKLTIDEVIESITDKLKSGDMFVHKESAGTTLDFMTIAGKASSGDVKIYTDAVNQEVAKSFDIPLNVFDGSIPANAKTANDFITFAVQPVVKAMNDTLNAKVVGKSDYLKGERAFFWLARFSHIDVVDAAASLDKLRGIGFSYDEIREMVGYEPLNTEFSTARALTLNYSSETSEEGESDGSTDDQGDETNNKNTDTPKLSKHKERRLRKNGKA